MYTGLSWNPSPRYPAEAKPNLSQLSRLSSISLKLLPQESQKMLAESVIGGGGGERRQVTIENPSSGGSGHPWILFLRFSMRTRLFMCLVS